MWNSQPLSAQGGRAASLIGQGGENKIGLLDLPTPFLFLEVSCLQAMVVPCPPPTTHSITVLQVKAAKSPFSVLRNPFSCHIYPHPPILSLLVKKKKKDDSSPHHPLTLCLTSVQNPGENREIIYGAPSKTSRDVPVGTRKYMALRKKREIQNNICRMEQKRHL